MSNTELSFKVAVTLVLRDTEPYFRGEAAELDIPELVELYGTPEAFKPLVRNERYLRTLEARYRLDEGLPAAGLTSNRPNLTPYSGIAFEFGVTHQRVRQLVIAALESVAHQIDFDLAYRHYRRVLSGDGNMDDVSVDALVGANKDRDFGPEPVNPSDLAVRTIVNKLRGEGITLLGQLADTRADQIADIRLFGSAKWLDDLRELLRRLGLSLAGELSGGGVPVHSMVVPGPSRSSIWGLVLGVV